MHQLIQIPGRIAKTKDREFLYFSGTNYLGIGQLPAFQAFVKRGMSELGLNFGGSRLSNVRFEIFEQAESFLAEVGQAEAALTVSSGTVAGQLVAKYFENIGPLYFAPESHPALRLANEKQYSSRADWIAELIVLSHQSGGPIIAFSDAIDSLHVQLFDFEWLNQLGHSRQIILVVDDSHTWGITGVNGGGSYTLLHPPNHVELVIVASLGKAYGIPAGLILGKSTRIASIWQTPFFGGASPSLPAFLFAMTQSQMLYQQQRKRLFEITSFFRQQVAPFQCFESYQDYPVFYTSANTLPGFLLEHGVLISSFPYPSPDSPLVNRVVLNALHTDKDIEHLMDLIQHFFEQT